MRRSLLARLCAVVLVVGLIESSGTAPDVGASAGPGYGGELMAQLGSIGAVKASYSSAEKKIASRLVIELRRRQGDALVLAMPEFRTKAEVAEDGTTRVKIKGDVNDELVAAVEAAGGTVLSSFPKYGAMDVRVPITALVSLAERDDVSSIREPDLWRVNQTNTSEGDVAHRADIARSVLGVDGSSRRACALSDGVDELANVQATDDLPGAVVVLPGQEGAGSSGTAMLEIVHDLAPGAGLVFATAGAVQEHMAGNIGALADRGCSVIFDDVTFFSEPFYQDGVIAQAVSAVVNDDRRVTYFSSAGNDGNLSDGTGSVWEGDFVDSGFTFDDVSNFFPGLGPPPIGGTVHSFSGQPSNIVEQDGIFPVVLQWADPLGGSDNDYDLCIIDPTGLEYDCSTDPQEGTQDPIEIINTPPQAGDHIIVINWGGQAKPRHFIVDAFGAPLAKPTQGSIGGHAGGQDVIAVGAVDVAQAGGGPFEGTAEMELFSSDGPRRVFFDADGTPFTPGDFSSTGGIVRQKPDIAAADGVSTATAGFDPFFGTSAAAPHAAGIAVLMQEANPRWTATEIRSAMFDTALDIEDVGFDDRSGFGILDGFDAVDAALSLKTKHLFEFTNPGPETATGLNIFFLFTGGALNDPAIVVDTTDCSLALIEVKSANDVSIDWGETCAQPGATVTLSVFTRFLNTIANVVDWKVSTCPAGGAGSVCPVTSTPTSAPPPATPTPAPATPTPTATPQPDGDVNDDGMTTSVDALFILQFSAGFLSVLPKAENADVNLDGDITSIDSALILQFVGGFLGSLPP